LDKHRKPAVSNGNPHEQALIRAWWWELKQGKGRLVWEYHLEGRYADAIWFPEAADNGVEETGKDSQQRFPIAGERVVLCEAKSEMTPELVGQALVYSEFARRAGGDLQETIVFTYKADQSMREAAAAYGLSVITPEELSEIG